MQINTIVSHAKMASMLIDSLRAIASRTGKLDLTEGKAWSYDWALLNALIIRIPTMQTVCVCDADTEYNGCWIRREIVLDFHLFGTDYKGTLSVHRNGPGLDNYFWSFIPSV